MELVIIFCVGALVGAVVTLSIFRMWFVGSLRIDTSDPEDGPYMFLELSKGMNNISSKKYAILKVKPKNFIPRK